MTDKTAEDRREPPVMNCRNNPRKGPCCLHPEQAAREATGEWIERDVCCWCGSSTEWKVTFVPEHGPKQVLPRQIGKHIPERKI